MYFIYMLRCISALRYVLTSMCFGL